MNTTVAVDVTTEAPAIVTLDCRAEMIGSSLNTRGLDRAQMLATRPVTMRVGETGYAVLFRFGVVVTFNVPDSEAAAVREVLIPLISAGEILAPPEPVSVVVDPTSDERVRPDSKISIKAVSVEHLQLIAEALAKSVILEHYENVIARVFDQVVPAVEQMQRVGQSRAKAAQLLRQIGAVLATQHQMVGRVEVTEKPELLWDRPDLERFYSQLATEFELIDRDRALTRKLNLISDTAQVLLNLVYNKRTLRVEWYIVILIVVEILLTLYELFVPAH